MNRTEQSPRSALTDARAVLVMSLLLLPCLPLMAQEEEELPGLEYIWHDPEKIVTSQKCGECHASELAVWEETKHATGFYTMHRRESAQRIQEAMGFKLIKRESLCLKCHYTAYLEDEQVRAAEGVSCESCHGAGRDWIDVHNNYGPGNTYDTEPPEHKQERISESVANGMKRPSQIYEVVASCFRCHTVPHEELVNKGGHTTGSTNFELVSRIDKIRHNFLQAQFDPTKTENRENSPERKRLLYVSGKAADLEYSIRGAAKATENGGYIRALQRRVRTIVIQLSGINATVNIPQIQRILNLVGEVSIGPNRESELLAVADKIEQQIRALIEEHDGTQLADLDPFVSGEKTPTAPAPATTSTAEPSTTEPSAETGAATTTPSDQPAASTETASADRPTQPAYPKKKHIRPRSQHDTIGPSCSCHRDQNDWWATDRHYQSVQPFLERASRNVQIARLYGINPDDMAKGNQLCMDCHGTVVTGQEAFDVFDGVSCESCHGPAGDYKEPHSSENPPNGYPVGKEHGMVLLEDAQTRAQTCAQCHYITDPRLISTGHPTGNTFNLASTNQKIVHWKEPKLPPRQLRDAFEQVKQSRGAIPDVERITATSSPSTTSSSSAASPASSSPEPATRSVAPEPPKPRPVPARSVAQKRKNIDLPPFPDISDSTTVEETLLLLKQRLELIHKKLGSN